MPFSKSFPKTVDKSPYPRWEEIYLSDEEEKETEKRCRHENIALMKECIEDAKKIFSEKKLKDFQSDVINAAIALFEKRASHSVYWKENKAKEKFDKLFREKD
ncbi:MAG: hypothetical protein ISS25_00580 [Nanoarchaeota archaeon]|nr:hypothetical protein [DPANN group archaeon]MBL7116312.1 hypothetical protein [Nanoarchaeota archaeon]